MKKYKRIPHNFTLILYKKYFQVKKTLFIPYSLEVVGVLASLMKASSWSALISTATMVFFLKPYFFFSSTNLKQKSMRASQQIHILNNVIFKNSNLQERELEAAQLEDDLLEITKMESKANFEKERIVNTDQELAEELQNELYMETPKKSSASASDTPVSPRTQDMIDNAIRESDIIDNAIRESLLESPGSSANEGGAPGLSAGAGPSGSTGYSESSQLSTDDDWEQNTNMVLDLLKGKPFQDLFTIICEEKIEYDEDGFFVDVEKIIQHFSFLNNENIAGDGNCLFHTIKHQLNNMPEHLQTNKINRYKNSSHRLRLLACEHIESSEADMMMSFDDARGNMRKQDFLEKMRQDKHYGNIQTLVALACEFNLHVILINCLTAKIEEYLGPDIESEIRSFMCKNNHSPDFKIFIVYNGHNHFSSLTF